MTGYIQFYPSVEVDAQELTQFATDWVRNAGVVNEVGGSLGFAAAQLSPLDGLKYNVTGGGRAYVLNSNYGANGTNPKYWLVRFSGATETLTFAANSSGSTRIDLICIKVDTTVTDGETDNTGVASLVVVQGTPGAGVPSTPDDHLALYRVTIANGETEITSAEVTDVRVTCTLNVQLRNTVYKTSTGTYSKPLNMHPEAYVIVEVQGGGAGGGGAPATTSSGNWAFASGGGAGAYAKKKILMSSLSASETVTVGGGGAGGVGNNNGASGGNSSFGSHLSANGSTGGGTASGIVTALTYRGGGVGATTTGGTPDISIPGGRGGAGWLNSLSNLNAIGGDGGDSVLGVGGAGANDAGGGGDGSAGGGYGSGGGGAAKRQSQAGNQTGGAGAAGIVIIHEYY